MYYYHIVDTYHAVLSFILCTECPEKSQFGQDIPIKIASTVLFLYGCLLRKHVFNYRIPSVDKATP